MKLKKRFLAVGAALAGAAVGLLLLTPPNLLAQFEQRVRNSDDIDFMGAISVRSDVFLIKDQVDATKKIKFDVSGITTGTTRTYVLPDSSGPIGVQTATTCSQTTDGALCWDTDDNLLSSGDGSSRKTFLDVTSTQTGITGKTLLDTGTTFANTSATTKKFQFLASGVTAGQTRILTVPDYDGTIATLAGTESLSNKTLASPAVSGTVTGTNIAVTSTGDLDLTASGGSGDVTINAGRNIDILSPTAGYFNLQLNDGDVSIQTAGSADDIVLAAASNGSNVYINSGLRLDRQNVTTSTSTTWRSIAAVTTTASARTVTIEADNNVSGTLLIIKDESGGASTNNPITITPESGNIDGLAGSTINTDYGSKILYGNGTNWFTICNDPGVHKLLVTGYAKVGADAGWTVGAANNVGRLATQAAGTTGADLIVPISGLPVGARIIAFHVLGQGESGGNTATLDVDLRKLTAAAADLTDGSVTTMTQLSISADTAVTAANTLKTLASPETVDTDESFYFAIAGTTAAATDWDLMALVVHYIQ